MATLQQLKSAARQVAQCLVRHDRRLVFAESCTGGLVSALLAAIPGISHHLCGSAVVYRIDTKARWLDVPRPMLERPGPVSREVATAMALGVLRETPEADLAASVTGHLGPGAPPRQDGLVFVCVAQRRPGANAAPVVAATRHRLGAGPSAGSVRLSREFRQRAAALLVLNAVLRQLHC